MKVLSFSALEVLPALLDHTKVQTVRPAFCKDCLETGNKTYVYGDFTITPKPRDPHGPEGPTHNARFAVGETVSIQWHQRTSPKGSWFCYCSSCNRELPYKNTDNILKETSHGICPVCLKGTLTIFPKILGTVEITEAFQIVMTKNRIELSKDDSPSYGKIIHFDEIEKIIAMRDGFKSAEEMFNWFDKRYDLSSPKKFWVYRWRWLP